MAWFERNDSGEQSESTKNGVNFKKSLDSLTDPIPAYCEDAERLDSTWTSSCNDWEVLVEHDELATGIKANSKRTISRPVSLPQSLLQIEGRNGNFSHSTTPTRSSTDLPNQLGNTLLPGNEQAVEGELQENGETPMYVRHEQWATNYKEAAIFLEEGLNNDKFSHHPRSKDALPAYLLVHTTWFHLLDLAASLVLLGLGFFEAPSVTTLSIPPQVHAVIELCTLLLITVLTALRTRWIGWKTFFKHKRTFIKVATLTVMIGEAVLVIVRQKSHFRVTRALRPIFIIDNYYCGGVRRFVRQILQSLSPILDMLLLVFFMMLIYSVFGFYLFGTIDRDHFDTLSRSFISLFVLLTTANFPDVMMTSYQYNRASAAFFISYLSINLYFLMNLMLAVVYDVFTRIEKDKFRRLFLHKRKAAQHAFGLLVTKDNPDKVSFQHFEGLLAHYKPRASLTEVYLIFKLLAKDKTGYLSMNEFYGVYDACLYSWRVLKNDSEWYSHMRGVPRRIVEVIHDVVSSNWFEYGVCLVVLANGVILVVQTSILSSGSTGQNENYTAWVSYFFVCSFTCEACLKLLGLGIHKYFSSYWNLFDFVVTVLGIGALILECLGMPLFYIIILRPFRLLTLFHMKKRFRDVFGTAVILIPRLMSAIVVLLLLYYFFAIIGVECFHDLPLKNCCVNTSVEQFYKYTPGSGSNAYFYLNNFNNMPVAGVTLFELTVVNNWFLIMEGHAIVTTEWSRIFFMMFYIVTMIVMTIIVAFILEAFLFRIQYKEFLSKQDEIKRLSAEIHVAGEELLNVVRHWSAGDRDGVSPIRADSSYRFVGRKSRTKEQLQMLMYSEEMEQWLAEASHEETRARCLLRAAALRESCQDEGSRMSDSDSLRRRRNFISRNFDCDESTIANGVVVQVVEDEDEITTIRRQVLPDLT